MSSPAEQTLTNGLMVLRYPKGSQPGILDASDTLPMLRFIDDLWNEAKETANVESENNTEC